MKVILFKDEKQPADKYRTCLEAKGHDVHFVPVLKITTIPLAVQLVAHRLASPDFNSIVLTSGRAVDALAQANVQRFAAGFQWFALGRETSSRLNELLQVESFGGDCKNAKELIDHVLIPQCTADTHRFLFLSGSSRLDTVPCFLRDGGFTFDEVVVYESVGIDDLDLAVGENQGRAVGVYFSPKGTDAVRHYLAQHHIPEPGQFFVGGVAIGETTASALDDRWGEYIHVASKPSPDGVAAALDNLAVSLGSGTAVQGFKLGAGR